MLNQGKILILGMVSVAFAAAIFGWWWNYQATRHSLAFWGTVDALRVAGAPNAELLALGEPEGSESTEPHTSEQVISLGGRKYPVLAHYDVGHARGFGNVRRLLVQDQSFHWEKTPPAGATPWEFALRFSDAQGESMILLAPGAALVGSAGETRTAVLKEEAARVFAAFAAEQRPESPAGASPGSFKTDNPKLNVP
jgi:hypothetical protein